MRNAGRKLMATGGVLLIAAALCMTGYNFVEAERAAESAQKALQEIKSIEEIKKDSEPKEDQDEKTPEIPDYILNPEKDMPTVEADGIEYVGILEIPALGLTLPVISEWSYDKLEIAPCRYTGTAYKDDLIIAAHNYEGHFGELDGLEVGDEILFTDMDENVFSYNVSGMEELPGTALEEMEAGEWDLTLFTCTASGKNRVTVRCDKIG